MKKFLLFLLLAAFLTNKHSFAYNIPVDLDLLPLNTNECTCVDIRVDQLENKVVSYQQMVQDLKDILQDNEKKLNREELLKIIEFHQKDAEFW